MSARRGSRHVSDSELVRFASLVGLAGLALGALSFVWYSASLPDPLRGNLQALMTPGLRAGMLYPLVLLAALFGSFAFKPAAARPWAGGLALAFAFAAIGSFERARELIRKPYLIPNYMYSNQIVGGDIPAKGVSSELPAINEKGILNVAPFVPSDLRTVTDANRLQAGRMVALIECSACHTFQEKGLRPLPERIRRIGAAGPDDVSAVIDGLAGMPYMPPFAGTDAEKRALAEYLFSISK